MGFDEEPSHYMGVAVRESVVNAIKHGNRLDESKRVQVGSRSTTGRSRSRSATRAGFDPASVADPLAPENLLKAYGRGIFFMRQFMDEDPRLSAARAAPSSGC